MVFLSGDPIVLRERGCFLVRCFPSCLDLFFMLLLDRSLLDPSMLSILLVSIGGHPIVAADVFLVKAFVSRTGS